MAASAAHDEPDTLGQRVRRLRLTNGLTQGQLAARMRITQVRVSQIEAGEDARPLRLRTLCDLADGLGVDLDALIAGDPLYEHIDINDVAALPPTQTSLRPVSPLIDRAAELGAVRAHLRDGGTRLLTLVGPAGVGKTQLALHAVAALQADHLEQHVVSLATCRDAASLVTAIARAIGLRERDARPLRERLVTALRDRRVLLLLDNVEQVLPAAANLVAELVALCPRLTLLVTSRAPLRIQAEQVFTVHPLRLPEAGSPVTLATATNASAIQMFVHRARSAVPGFAVTEANAAQITAICRRLDGLPLAIELAAPRTRVMTLDQLLRQIDHRLALLTAGARDLPLRQQSLRASIAWSIDLLSSDQQALFRRLSVFADGFTLDAAIAVIADAATQQSTEWTWSAAEVANGIGLLIEQNVLTRQEQTHAHPRFRMLETIHEYAREQLAAAGEEVPLRERHLRWISSLAERADAELCGFEQDAWLHRLDAEWENARTALNWAMASENALGALHLAVALTDFWYLRGMLSEGAAFLERTLDLMPGAPADHDLVRAQVRALSAASQIAQPRGDLAGAGVFAEESLLLARAIGDRQGEAQALALLGNHALTRGHLATAATRHRAALLHFRELGGNHRWVIAGLNNLSQIAYEQGSHQEALSLASEALSLATSAGDAWGLALAHQRLGDAALALGQNGQAAHHFVWSLVQNRSQQSEWGIANAVAACGSLATAAGEPERGVRLFAAASSLYQSMGVSIPPKLRPDWTRMLDRARASTGSVTSARAWSEGSQLTAEEAVAEALTIAVQITVQGTVSPDSPGPLPLPGRLHANRRVRKGRSTRSGPQTDSLPGS
jgi:non-specific serine/threonine protein kinase